MSEISRKKVILHVIEELPLHGAETQLWHFLRNTDSHAFEHHVLTIKQEGPLKAIIEQDLHMPVNEFADQFPLGPDTNKDQLVYEYARRTEADCIQAWTTGIFNTEQAASLNKTIIWRLGNERTIAEVPDEMREPLIRCAEISGKIPDHIICNSQAVFTVYSQKNGFDMRNMRVIEPGVDGGIFKPNSEARAKIRKELGITDDTPLIGIIARNHPQKDFPTFFAAAELFHERRPEVRFLLVGEGQHPTVEQQKYIFFTGERIDIPEIAASLDIGTSSSMHEATGNSVIEMCASGVLCAVTDTGIMEKIVGDTGIVVPRQSPEQLADAWETLLDKPIQNRAGLSARTRAHVLEHFDLRKMVEAYEDIYYSAGPEPANLSGGKRQSLVEPMPSALKTAPDRVPCYSISR